LQKKIVYQRSYFESLKFAKKNIAITQMFAIVILIWIIWNIRDI